MTNYTKESMDALKEAVFNLSQADDEISLTEAKSEIAKVQALKDALVMKKTSLVAEDFESLTGPAQDGEGLENAFDGNLSSLWHTSWSGGDVGKPATMVLREATDITGFRYIPRASGSNGNLRDLTLVVTDETGKEHSFTASNWADTNKPKEITFGQTIKAKKIVLTGTRTYGDGGNQYQSAAELVFMRPQVAEAPLDTAPYDAALAKAQTLADKSKQEEVASVVASMAFAREHHLLTSRMVDYFATYLNQLQAPMSSKGDEAAPVIEIPAFTGGVNGAEAAVHEVPAYTEAVGTVGDEAAPVVEIPDFTGGVNGVEAAVHEVPAYTEAVGTVGDEAAPVVEVPEFTGGVNGVEAAVHEVPEFKGGVNAVQAAQNDLPAYTGGANGLEAAVLDLPAYKLPENESHQSNLTSPQQNLHLLSDPATGVMVIGRDSELGTATNVHVQRVMDQALQGKRYDAYAIQLLDPTHTRVEPTGAVLVRLPLTGAVEALYDLTTNETVDFTLKGDWLEFTTTHLGTYAVVYKEMTTSMTGESSPSLATEMKGEDKAMLPATGEAASSALLLAGLSLGATALFMAKTKKES